MHPIPPTPPPYLVTPIHAKIYPLVRHGETPRDLLVAYGEMTRRYLLVPHGVKRWGWGAISYILANITIRFLSNIS